MALMTDIGSSILAKLKNKAKQANISYQQCLQLFFQEEFLRRLSKSPYIDNLVLKGGLFIYTLTSFKSRATVDIDFLMQRLDNNPDYIEKIISEIIGTSSGLNEIVTLESGKCSPITAHRDYHGLSCQITGKIKKVRVPFFIDIGIGDIIFPKPEKRIIQTQLEGYDIPKVYTYSLESTIAEKLDAIFQRLELTGRMKDFYDIYYIALTFNFNGKILRKAIMETLHNRKTEINSESFNHLIRLADNRDIQVRWQYFQKTINQTGLLLTDVMRLINGFLSPVVNSIVFSENFTGKWNAKNREWV
jgi:predicted nucleotidyltransferase component of viral defense system